MQLSFNRAIIFTLIRLIGSFIFPFFLMHYVPLNSLYLNLLLASIFLLLGITDYLDGYYARRDNRITVFGKILDPLADKLLIYSTCIALVAVGKLYFYWIIAFLSRDFLVMGLRQSALEHGFDIPVSYSAKLKTATQILCFAFIITKAATSKFDTIEEVMLSITLLLSIYTAVDYYRKFILLRQKTPMFFKTGDEGRVEPFEASAK